MISVYLLYSFVFNGYSNLIEVSCFANLFFDYIAHYIADLRADYIVDYICELSYATCTGINSVGTTVQFAFAVPVSGLIPDLKRSDGSFPQASCN